MMMKNLLALILIVLSTPVVAQQYLQVDTALLAIPADYEAIGYRLLDDKRATVTYMSQAETNAFCAQFQNVSLAPGQVFYGCTVKNDYILRPTTWEVVISYELPLDLQAQTYAHEFAHVGGWPADHTHP